MVLDLTGIFRRCSEIKHADIVEFLLAIEYRQTRNIKDEYPDAMIVEEIYTGMKMEGKVVEAD